MGERIENTELARLIAGLLDPRDDIASAEAVDNEVDVVTQGGSHFRVVVT